MNVFWREIKASRKSFILWTIGMLLMVVSGMSKYAGMSDSGQSMNELMADLPQSMQAIMGTGVFDLSKASGYYGVLYLYILLIATLHAVLLGANIISKEERDKTSEFLYVKPLSRRKIILAKLAAAFTSIILLNLLTFISSLLSVSLYSNGEVGITGEVTLLMIGMLLLQILFMAIGSGISAVIETPKRATSIGTSILLFSFLLSIVIDLKEDLDFLSYLTPFKYFDAKTMMYGGGFDLVFVTLSIAIIIVFLSITFIFFQHRDLKV
jgi:ABC-2 type transport system permease protein